MIKVLIFICLLSFISCKSNTQKVDKKANLTPELASDSSYYVQLNIDNLKNSLKDSQIRIWISFSLVDSGKIINLKNESGYWKGEFYEYRFNIGNNSISKTLVSKKITTANPYSGWRTFLKQIEKSGLFNLSDSDRILNSGLCTDANEISIEIVRENKYTEYIYPCWDAIEDQTQIKKIMNILHYIEIEFGFKIFPIL